MERTGHFGIPSTELMCELANPAKVQGPAVTDELDQWMTEEVADLEESLERALYRVRRYRSECKVAESTLLAV